MHKTYEIQKVSSFQVYNASAGSGKTFTLVKEYLKILLSSNDIFLFQKILAITFTNKAAGEMKERILSNLQTFAHKEENDLIFIILNETNLDKETIQIRSKKIVEAILQNYAGFSITTIDSFTHKIIKNFAFDLGLSLNFDVEMDAISLLNEAVDVLISKIGSEVNITKLLINFSLDKIDDDKSWDISRELNDIAKILLNESDVKHISLLASKEFNDFNDLKNKLSKYKIELLQEIKNKGKKALEVIENVDLQVKDFYKGTFPKFLKDLSEFNYSFDFKKRSETIDKAVKNHTFYTKTAKPEIKNSIENILPELVSLFESSKEVYGQLILCELTLKSLIPLAVVNNINTELNDIKERNNIRLNAEFNQLIANHIKNQPSPFIYERIGQRFMHYFIDEMQDTSALQWKNLIPLIDNALAQENSNLMLVGDGKQAIYRWRGGKAEQFINLGSNDENSENPFQIAKNSKTLATNFRSFSEIINFNNNFFQHASKFLQKKSYQKLFMEGNQQLENSRKGGSVSINFLEKQKDKEAETNKYPKKVLETIKGLQLQFRLDEICILVRKKNEGIAIANYLSENSIPIVSSETLLLKNNAKVNFICDILQILLYPSDKDTLINILYFLHSHLHLQEKKHVFISKHSTLNNQILFESLRNYGTFFNLKEFSLLPFYEKIEHIIRGFHLTTTSDAYLQFFLDIVLEQQRNNADIQSFLDYWTHKKDTLSMIAPENTNAVQIMTIHKSKGLEFPVVIFPCDLDIYQQINPKIWLNSLPERYHPFEELLLPYNKDLNFISDRGKEIYEQQREELELDNLNLLYVALTRPIEQLHIITEKRISKTGENTNYYSGIFINYLKKIGRWRDTDHSYSFGTSERKSEVKEEKSITKIQDNFISSPWQDHNIYMLSNASKLWDTNQEEAIEYGNLIHEMLSKIRTKKDCTKVLREYTNQGIIQEKDSLFIRETIANIVEHPVLEEFFAEGISVFNEREILTKDHQIIIPDRLVIIEGNVVIIDYKTGKKSSKYHQQLLKYANVLKEMNLRIQKKLLVYIGEEILVEEV